MNDLMSENGFKWFLTILTGGLAGSWMIYDSINLIRLRGKDKKDPVIGDKFFGYIIGVIIGVVGVWGCLRFHGVV